MRYITVIYHTLIFNEMQYITENYIFFYFLKYLCEKKLHLLAFIVYPALTGRPTKTAMYWVSVGVSTSCMS